MLNIIPGVKIKELDESFIRGEGLSSFELMERAAEAFCSWFVGRFDRQFSIAVFCGTGNNGGDGLAISRLLESRGYKTKLFSVGSRSKASIDFIKNMEILPKSTQVQEVSQDPMDFLKTDIIIDAIFGAGINRPLDGVYLELIETLNEIEAIKISIDLPSGLPTDSVLKGKAFMAHHTVSFQFPKLSLLFPEHSKYTGALSVLDIGIGNSFFSPFKSRLFFLEERDMAERHIRFDRFSHKGDFGKVMLIGGSFGKMGSIRLSALAALRTGSGLVSCFVPKCGVEIVQTALSEVMVEASGGEFELGKSGLRELDRFDALGVGPGMGTGNNARECLQSILTNYQKPTVLDADAINLLGANRSLFALLRPNVLLTPHLKEFERLVGPSKDHVERMEKARSFCKAHSCVVILKGAHTLISLPGGDQFFNSSGTPFMATGGAGDVLTGMLTSFLGQGYSPENAAICGVYHHGLAGELASRSRFRGTIASDIVESIPDSFVQLNIL